MSGAQDTHGMQNPSEELAFDPGAMGIPTGTKADLSPLSLPRSPFCVRP